MWDPSSMTRHQTHATCSGSRVLTTEPLGLPIEELLQQRPGSQDIGRLSLIKENQILKLRNLVLFSIYRRRQESWLAGIIPLICTSAIWGQHPGLFHPESPQGTHHQGQHPGLFHPEGTHISSGYTLYLSLLRYTPSAVVAEGWQLQHPWSIDMAGSSCHSHSSLVRYSRQNFIISVNIKS